VFAFRSTANCSLLSPRFPNTDYPQMRLACDGAVGTSVTWYYFVLTSQVTAGAGPGLQISGSGSNPCYFDSTKRTPKYIGFYNQANASQGSTFNVGANAAIIPASGGGAVSVRLWEPVALSSLLLFDGWVHLDRRRLHRRCQSRSICVQHQQNGQYTRRKGRAQLGDPNSRHNPYVALLCPRPGRVHTLFTRTITTCQ
jgi:hypothetical protein